MKLRYNALGLVAALYKVVGVLIWVAAILGVIVLIVGTLVTPSFSYTDPVTGTTYNYASPILANLATALVLFFVGTIVGLFLFAIGQVFDLLRDVELHLRKQTAAAEETAFNARKTAQALEYMVGQRNQRQAVPRTSISTTGSPS